MSLAGTRRGRRKNATRAAASAMEIFMVVSGFLLGDWIGLDLREGREEVYI